MREIKFRAWFDGHMYEVAKLDFWGDPDQATCDMAGSGENGEWEELFDIYVGEVELMQYTGLKDKNGEEIYPGDFVVNVVDGFQDTLEELIETYDKAVGKLLHARDTLYGLLGDIGVVKKFVESEKAKEG